MSKIVYLDEMYEYENEAEARNAQILPPANLGFIKTQLAITRKELQNLRPDPESYSKYVQDHAGLSGAISAYEHLLSCHNEVIAKIAVDA